AAAPAGDRTARGAVWRRLERLSRVGQAAGDAAGLAGPLHGGHGGLERGTAARSRLRRGFVLPGHAPATPAVGVGLRRGAAFRLRLPDLQPGTGAPADRLCLDRAARPGDLLAGGAQPAPALAQSGRTLLPR